MSESDFKNCKIIICDLYSTNFLCFVWAAIGNQYQQNTEKVKQKLIHHKWNTIVTKNPKFLSWLSDLVGDRGLHEGKETAGEVY